MKTHHLRSLIWLLGCLGCAVFISEAADSPTQQALESYPYQPNLVAVPAPAASIFTAASSNPVVDPSFITTEPKDRSFRDLETAMANQRDRGKASLWVWEMRWNTELRLVERPTFHQIDIPWSPMVTPSEIAFSPSSMGAVSNKLQAWVPLGDFSW